MVDASTLLLSIICVDPPPQAEVSIMFGLQDKSGQLTPGQVQADGSLRFECSVQVKQLNTEDSLDFAGPAVHGKAGQRFLYLSLGTRQNQQWQWIRRLKIPLSGITPSLIDEGLAESRMLEASVDGTRSGTVPLLNQGWTITQRK